MNVGKTKRYLTDGARKLDGWGDCGIMIDKAKVMKLITVIIVMVSILAIILIFVKEDKIKEITGLRVINDSGMFDSEAEKKSNLIIILTNQSFFKSDVELNIYIDGIKLINKNCKVENQHKSYNYYYSLEGTHEIRVESEDGIELVKRIVLDANVPLWNIFTYWNSESEGASLSYDKMETPFRWD